MLLPMNTAAAPVGDSVPRAPLCLTIRRKKTPWRGSCILPPIFASFSSGCHRRDSSPVANILHCKESNREVTAIDFLILANRHLRHFCRGMCDEFEQCWSVEILDNPSLPLAGDSKWQDVSHAMKLVVRIART